MSQIKRYFGIVLALVICAGMCTPVFGIECVSEVNVYGVTPPVAGESPNFQANVWDTGYTVSYMKWIDMETEDYMTEESVFKLGGVYRALFVVNVSDDSRYIFNSVVVASMNGIEGVVDIVDDTTVIFYYEFIPCPDTRAITVVNITNVVPPAPGENPVYNASVSEGITLQNIAWGCMDTMGAIDSDHVFEEGNTYRIVLWISLSDPINYSFGESLTVTVYGAPATEIQNNIDIDGTVTVCYDFPPCGMGPQYLPGDVNTDGKVSIADVTLLLKYIAKWDVDVDVDIADVTGEGNVNVADATLLLKYIAKWNVELK